MRIDPDAVYLELNPGALLYNPSTGKARNAAAVLLHWKAGRRWHRRSIVATGEEGMPEVLRNVAAMIEAHGLEAMLEELVAV